MVSVRQARGLPAGLVLSPTSDFLRIPPRGGHPCLRLYPSHYRADSGLAPVRNVRRRAHIQTALDSGVRIVACTMSMDVMGIKKEELIDGIEYAGVASYLGDAEMADVNLFI